MLFKQQSMQCNVCFHKQEKFFKSFNQTTAKFQISCIKYFSIELIINYSLSLLSFFIFAEIILYPPVAWVKFELPTHDLRGLIVLVHEFNAFLS